MSRYPLGHGFDWAREQIAAREREEAGMNAETTEMLREDETTERPLLTDEEIAVLNSARTILAALGDRAERAARRVQFDTPHDVLSDSPWPSWYGRVEEAAAQAAEGLFGALSRARIYGGCPMTDAQVHNRPVDVQGHRVLSGDPGDAAPAYVDDGRDPFQGDSPGEHDRRL